MKKAVKCDKQLLEFLDHYDNQMQPSLKDGKLVFNKPSKPSHGSSGNQPLTFTDVTDFLSALQSKGEPPSEGRLAALSGIPPYLSVWHYIRDRVHADNAQDMTIEPHFDVLRSMATEAVLVRNSVKAGQVQLFVLACTLEPGHATRSTIFRVLHHCFKADAVFFEDKEISLAREKKRGLTYLWAYQAFGEYRAQEKFSLDWTVEMD